MAITFFGVAAEPADNDAQAGPNVTFTPPASMVDGDLVYVSHRYRDSAATLSISNTGGQTWESTTQYNTTNIRARVYWCRFNGTWSSDPVFTNTTGTNNADCEMLVFRPTSPAYTWTLESGPNSATYAAPSTPFTVTITGRTTTAASTVSIAAWHSVDDNSWGTLSGTGWSKTGLSAQYRNNSASDNSATFAYRIMTSAGATNNVSQNQTALGGDAGSTSLFTFAETLATAAIGGVASTSVAGSLGIAIAIVGTAGVLATALVGTAVIPGGGANATATPSGTVATAAAGSVATPFSSVAHPPGAGFGASVGMLGIPGLVIAPVTGVNSTTAVGTLVGIGAAPGVALAVGMSSAATAGSLGKAITVAGIAGVSATGAAGALTVQSGGFILATGHPSPVFALAQAGTPAVLAGPSAGGVAATLSAEALLGSLIATEVDGVLAQAVAGAATVQISTLIEGVQAAASAGAPAPIILPVVAAQGVEALATLGNMIGFGSGSAVGVPGGVETAGQVGAPAPAWTFAVPLTGVAAAGAAGDAAVEGGDSVPEEIFPTGVEASAQVGIITTGEALASIAGAATLAQAGTITVLGAGPVIGYLTATVQVRPALVATVQLRPALTASEVTLRPLQ